MLKRIVLSNFKSIKFCDFQCARLNLLTGLNGSGKSSFIQFLGFLRSYASRGRREVACCPYKQLALPGNLETIKYCYAGKDELVEFHVDFDTPTPCFTASSARAQYSHSLDCVIYRHAEGIRQGDDNWVSVNDRDVYMKQTTMFKALKSAMDEAKKRTNLPITPEVERLQQEFHTAEKESESVDGARFSEFQDIWRKARMVDAFRGRPTAVHISSDKFGSMEFATTFDLSGLDPEGGDAIECLYKFGKIFRLDQENPMIYPGSRLQERKIEDTYSPFFMKEQENYFQGIYFNDDPLRRQCSDGSLGEYSTLYDQVNAWLKVISPGAYIDVSKKTVGDEDFYQASVGFGEKESDVTFRPQNVGFGISYVLPVLVTILTARPGNIVMIENPEATSIPRGSQKLENFLHELRHMVFSCLLKRIVTIL